MKLIALCCRAQFHDENRTIFNTPNPRLMNVSLLSGRETTRKGSSAGRQQNRENAVAAAAAVAALHLGRSSIITQELDLEVRRTSGQGDRAEAHALLRQGQREWPARKTAFLILLDCRFQGQSGERRQDQ